MSLTCVGDYYYTIPRTVRELQPSVVLIFIALDYTIPRTVRELQPNSSTFAAVDIIPYQELLGNYNIQLINGVGFPIIPYQELLGNYNDFASGRAECVIIPYQELLGNYNAC